MCVGSLVNDTQQKKKKRKKEKKTVYHRVELLYRGVR